MAFENIHTKYQAQALDLPPAADLIAMLDDGETYASLAATFGCSPDTIRGRVNRSGIRDQKPQRPTAATALGIPQLANPACADTKNPDAFFSHEAWQIDQARSICRRCPAIRDCLAWALTHREDGIWAGTTPEQRDALRRRHTSLPAKESA